MTRGGILAGSDPDGPDPDKGKPHRHTRQKCRLLLNDIGGRIEAAEVFRDVLDELVDKRPEDVLDALIKVSGET